MPVVPTTEMEEMEADELHLVKKGANGFPALLAKAAAEEVAAVLKADDEKKCSTCEGSGKIMDGNRKCPDCDGSGEVEKAALSAKERDAMDESDFAYVDSKGEKHLPIQDADHVQAALGRFDQTEFDSPADKKAAAKKILAAAKKFDIDVSEDSDVAEMAKSVLKAAEDEEPGSPGWETADAKTMADAAEMLLTAADQVKAFTQREVAELMTTTPGEGGEDDVQSVGDYTNVWDAQDALSLITMALGIVARLSAQETHEAKPDEVGKSGRVLSDKNVKGIKLVMKQLQDLLDSAGVSGDDTNDDPDPQASRGTQTTAKSAGEEFDMSTITKEVLFGWLDEREALAKAAAETKIDPAATGEPVAGTVELTAEPVAAMTPEVLKEAVTEGVRVALSPLEERLQVVEKSATPGGPSKTRPPEMLAKSAERDALLLKAEESERRAKGLSNDPELRKAYEKQAKEAREALASV